nr:zinc finger protein 271-like [Penaeus vannamei]
MAVRQKKLTGDYIERRSLSSFTPPSSLPPSETRVPVSKEPLMLRPKERHVQSLSRWKFGCAESVWSQKATMSILPTGFPWPHSWTRKHLAQESVLKKSSMKMSPKRATMRILPDRIPLALLKDKEILGTGVSIKEELNEGVTEEILQIKEELFDHADEGRDEVEVKHEFLSFQDLQDLRHKTKEKDSCDIEDCNTLSRASIVAEENKKKCSSEEDQTKQKESCTEVTHRKVARKLKRFLCEVCGKTFRNNTDLKIHLRVHTKEKPYSCDICNKDFSTKKGIVRHIRVHTKEKPYSCEFCNKAFSRKSDQIRHKRVHTKEKPYCCAICNQNFTEKNSLVKHMRIHTNEKPYSCEICNKDFTDKYDLVRHMRVHTKEKPYICQICNMAFTRNSSRVRHMRIHTKEKHR